jgi:hypothetical protein
MSKRKKPVQLQVPGTERTEVPEIEEAAERYREARDERAEMSKTEARLKLELLSLMRAHKLTLYRYTDGEGEEREVAAREDPKVKLRRVETDVDEEPAPIKASSGEPDGVHPGLIKGALDAQAEANVEESDDGDIVVRDTDAGKGKRSMTKAQREAKNARDRERRAKAKKGRK